MTRKFGDVSTFLEIPDFYHAVRNTPEIKLLLNNTFYEHLLLMCNIFALEGDISHNYRGNCNFFNCEGLFQFFRLNLQWLILNFMNIVLGEKVSFRGLYAPKF